MNWLVFAIVAWIMLGLEQGFRPALQVGHLNIAPSFALILLVFVALWARPIHALWAAAMLGAGIDMLTLIPTTTGETIVILGPWALASLLASYTVLNFRVMMFRKNPLTIAFLCAIGGGIAGVVALAIVAMRSFYDQQIILGSASSELWQRLASAAYTGVLAIPLAPLLQFFGRWMGFRKPHSIGADRR